jgi:hypothetical protein
MDGVRGLASWRWLFIIEGAITVGFAIFSLWAFPNYPHNTRCLKGEEKSIAQWRLVEDAGETDDTRISMWMGSKLAVLDWKVWVLVLNQLLLTIGAGIVVFYPTVVGTLGTLLFAPPYLLGCRHADKKQERRWHMVSTLCVTLVGLIILANSLNTGARYITKACGKIIFLACSFDFAEVMAARVASGFSEKESANDSSKALQVAVELVGGDRVAMGKIDYATVKALERMAPHASTADAECLRSKVLGGEVFKPFNDNERDEIWHRLERVGGFIPSLATFFQDVDYLELVSDCVKRFTGSTLKNVVSEHLEQLFSG